MNGQREKQREKHKEKQKIFWNCWKSWAQCRTICGCVS